MGTTRQTSAFIQVCLWRTLSWSVATPSHHPTFKRQRERKRNLREFSRVLFIFKFELGLDWVQWFLTLPLHWNYLGKLKTHRYAYLAPLFRDSDLAWGVTGTPKNFQVTGSQEQTPLIPEASGISTSKLTCWVTLGMFLNPSAPRFPCLEDRRPDSDTAHGVDERTEWAPWWQGPGAASDARKVSGFQVLCVTVQSNTPLFFFPSCSSHFSAAPGSSRHLSYSSSLNCSLPHPAFQMLFFFHSWDCPLLGMQWQES